MNAASIDATVATLWRVESPRVLARLARFVGDLDTAEELAQDTFVAAIEKWRQDGVPDNPAAWLHTTARYLAVDRIRRRDTQRNKLRIVAATSPQVAEHDLAELVDGDLADDLLGLVFMAAHPILSPDARSALTLKLVCGLATEDIARAFLVPGPTIAQRVVRAKRTLSAANIRFELPGPAERPVRLGAVREVIYLLFNEGYSATSGDSWMRTDLCAEALRLGRMLASLTPRDTESLGLLALMELQASRLKARTGPDGEPVLLMDQDRTRWDHLLIRRGLATLERIDQLGGTAGPYRPAGRDRRLPRASHHCRRHRLGPHRRALRRPGPDQPLPRRRAEPWRRGRPGVRTAGRAGHCAAPVRRRRASPVPPAAGGRRRPALPHRGAWSCPEALPPGGIVDQQHPGTHNHATPRGRVRRPTRKRQL